MILSGRNMRQVPILYKIDLDRYSYVKGSHMFIKAFVITKICFRLSLMPWINPLSLYKILLFTSFQSSKFIFMQNRGELAMFMRTPRSSVHDVYVRRGWYCLVRVAFITSIYIRKAVPRILKQGDSRYQRQNLVWRIIFKSRFVFLLSSRRV